MRVLNHNLSSAVSIVEIAYNIQNETHTRRPLYGVYCTVTDSTVLDSAKAPAVFLTFSGKPKLRFARVFV